MNLWRVAWRFVWSRPLVSSLTILGVALGAALVCIVLTLRRETEKTLIDESTMCDLVVGAKGSPLQLVLSSIYHLDVPTGNIPYARYEELKSDPRIKSAIPISLGDNHRGFRIIGTVKEYFESGTTQLSFREGHPFDKPFDAVLGAAVAAQTGLHVGDQFHGSHGLMAIRGSEEHEEFPFTVTGILAPTGTSIDRAIYTPLESIWQVHEHGEESEERDSHEGGEHDPSGGEDHAHEEEEVEEGGGFLFGYADKVASQQREVTAVLVQLNSPGMRLWMIDEIKTDTESMAASPIDEMLRLYQQVLAPMQRTLLAVAFVVVIVSALTILTTLYQSAERRRRDIAILRSLGAHPAEVFFLVLLEALFITMLGIVLGWILGHGGAHVASLYFQGEFGLAISAWTIDPLEVKSLVVIAVAGILAGVVPAIQAYRRPPANDLSAM